MASPTRTPPPPPPPPPPPAVEPIAPSSPPPEHPPVNSSSSDGPLSSENPAPAPPPPATPPPPTPGDSSPSSTPPPPPPLPPSADASPPPTPSADASPPLPQQGQASPQRPLPPSSPAPVSPPTPAPASSEAKSEQDAAEAESASESGSMTLAVVLAQTEDSTPQKTSSAEPSPTGSPQKESAVTIAKLLSGEAPAAAAAEGKATPDKVTPPRDTGSLIAAAAVTPVGGGGVRGGVGSKRWLLDRVPEKVRRAELRRAELGFRVSAAVFCLVALSVMAADTTTGWSGDSFRRYNEYRYVLAASVIAFTYSGFQLVAEVHYLVTGRRIIRAPFRSYFNLAMDQMLAYLLLSASSAALSRNGVWMSRFGGDQFTKLINASASMAFLAFIALGLNSVISAYCVFSLIS